MWEFLMVEMSSPSLFCKLNKGDQISRLTWIDEADHMTKKGNSVL